MDVQIDRLVGPTQHFGGLGVGNLASQQHAGQVSNPAAAAIQGLDKMRLVASYGVPQIILPPQPRPDFQFLRSLGFAGTDSDVLRRAADEAPHLLSAATSCSAMWTANAATVTPGIDSSHGATTLTIANLVASVHRAMEPERTFAEIAHVLRGVPDCRLLGPLPGGAAMRDEGAANHMRLGTNRQEPGIHLFVFGDEQPLPSSHWPRQSRAACEAIARRHELPPENTFFLKQHPTAVDAGAFHNDVVAMSHQNLLIHHELAFHEDDAKFQHLCKRFHSLTGTELTRLVVLDSSISIEDAVSTYLFNSQIVSPAGTRSGKPVIICTSQVKDDFGARALVESWCHSGVFEQVQFVDLDQSMSGGGGPACLRLRVPLPAETANSIGATSRWCESLDTKLRETIAKHYVSRLTLDDLSRIEFHHDAQRAQQRAMDVLLSDSW